MDYRHELKNIVLDAENSLKKSIVHTKVLEK